MTIVSTLYLSTDSVTNPPSNKTNLANVTWLVNWDEIFRRKQGLCKVTMNLNSKKGSGNDVWDSKVGMVFANFTSPFSLNSGGFPITALNRNQYVEITTDAQSVTTVSYVYYFSANNSQGTSPPVISIPEGKIPFTISLLDTKGAFISSIPEYNVQLFFDWISDEERKSLVLV